MSSYKLSDLAQSLQQTLPKAKLTAFQLPLCPSISLNLYDPDALSGPLSHDEAQAVVAEPAYWAFCWASGQVLAHFLTQHPNLVTGKTVLDVGSGSGVAAIAAAKAGAIKVIACDLDADARLACEVNAHENGVVLETLNDLHSLDTQIDMIIASDVLYDRDNYPLLETFKSMSTEILLADSRVKTLPAEGFTLRETLEARTWPDLNEFEEFNQVRIYSWQKAP